jgi:hypothetical protein
VTLINALCEHHDSPYELYRNTYKYTDCGPSVGVHVLGRGWLWCNRLRELGSYADMLSRGETITAVAVSSMVEGSDAEVPAVEVEAGPDFWARLDAAVEAVNDEACRLWDEANGSDDDPTCPECEAQGATQYLPCPAHPQEPT